MFCMHALLSHPIYVIISCHGVVISRVDCMHFSTAYTYRLQYFVVNRGSESPSCLSDLL